MRKLSKGQTLIETVVAIFVLIMGVTISLGLASYSYKIADDSVKSAVATGLARESIEVIKNMRDQTWLKGTPGTCTFPNDEQQNCVANWYSFLPNQSGGNYALILNPPSSYSLRQNPTSYALNYCVQSGTGIYVSATESLSCTTSTSSAYSRMLQVTPDTTTDPADFNFTDSGNVQRTGLLDLVSTVWWTGRSCPATTDPTTLPASCKVVLDMYLTDWQNQ